MQPLRHRFFLLIAAVYTNASMASCPESLIAEGLWSTSTPDWSSSIVYVVPGFTLRNDAGGDVDFNALSMAETIDVWIPGPSGEEEVYGLRDRGYLLFKDAPAGEIYGAGESITWEFAVYVADAPAFYPKKLSLRPEEGSVYGQFNYAMQSSEFTCSEGEPILTLIDATEADVEEIQLTAYSGNGLTAVTSFDATFEDTDGDIFTASSATGSITVTGLEPGEDYTCTVTPTNSIGTGAASDAITISTLTTQGMPVWLLHEASTS